MQKGARQLHHPELYSIIRMLLPSRVTWGCNSSLREYNRMWNGLSTTPILPYGELQQNSSFYRLKVQSIHTIERPNTSLTGSQTSTRFSLARRHRGHRRREENAEVRHRCPRASDVSLKLFCWKRTALCTTHCGRMHTIPLLRGKEHFQYREENRLYPLCW